MNDLTKQVMIQEDIKAIARAIQDSLNEKYTDKIGFCLLLFDFHKPGISNYISSARREDMILALRETADTLEAKKDLPPASTKIQ